MDAAQLIVLDDLVLRDDLDPRLGDRDDGLVEQYAEIFDALPPIEINQRNEVIDGWHRYLAARRVGVVQIGCVVVETLDDDDLADRMWESNLRHGVQYSRAQRKARGLKLYKKKLSTSEIADRVGVSAATVRRWTKSLRDEEKRIRDERIIELSGLDMSLRQIADELSVDDKTVGNILRKNAQMREIPHDDPMPVLPKTVDVGSEEAPGEAELLIGGSEPEDVAKPAADKSREKSGSDLDTDVLSVQEAKRNSQEDSGESETASSPEPIPDYILATARGVMGSLTETRPDGYVARLEVSDCEWMTITDDALSKELERELLTSAAAMCLWQEWMVWYQGGSASAFTDAFGKIGPVFVRGQAGQWRIVSKLRSILRRLRM